ncbi:MAG: sigma-70 family RNA polymerase sigma factor [Bdellovibrionales bacterium]|nr:sigma-70 family RNA polymerase sigma factor [Bdellovibrionales bacterium]
MSEGKTDLELIEEFKGGNQAAYEVLIERYSEKAFHLASRMCRNQEDAEEVLQDVFVTVFRKITGFEGKSSFSSWLYRVTVNSSLMKLRKRKQNRCVLMEEALSAEDHSLLLRTKEEHDTDTIALRKEVSEALQIAISKLPDEYRPVFILRDIDGLTSREVGKILGLSIPAVKSRLHRSRLMLRKKLTTFYREYSSGDAKAPLTSAGNM